MTFTTNQSIFRPTSPSTCSTPSPPNPGPSTSPSRRHFSTVGMARGRPDLGTSTSSRPGRRPRGRVRDPLGRTSQPFMGARTRPVTPLASHPLLLVWHPFTTPPVQPLIPVDAHRGRSPPTSADPGRYFSLSTTTSFHAPSGFNASVPLPSPGGHTSDTKPATVSGGWAR